MYEDMTAITSFVVDKTYSLLTSLTSLTRCFQEENVKKIQSIFLILAYIEGDLLYNFISEYVACSLASREFSSFSDQQIEKFLPRATVKQFIKYYADS